MATEQPKLTFIQRVLRFIRRYFIPLVLVLLIALLGLAFWGGRYSVYKVHPELTNADQANAILVKVGGLILLPSGETPTLATIKDAASAKKSQPFLANAANGDVLIVYSNAQIALVYRPSTNKLIAVGPVDTGAGNQTTPQVKNATTSTPEKK